MVIELDSRSKGRGFESHPILDGNGVKALPGSIPVHLILVHSIHEKKENKKKHLKKDMNTNISSDKLKNKQLF